MTADFPDFDSFWAKVQQTWDRQWRTVFGADWEGAGLRNSARGKQPVPVTREPVQPASIGVSPACLPMLPTSGCPVAPVAAGPPHLLHACVVQACQSCGRASPTPSTPCPSPSTCRS